MKGKKVIELTIYAFIILTLTILTIAAANADMIVPAQANLGSSSQERGVTASTTISVTNTDTTDTISDLTLSFTPNIAGYTAQDFNVTFPITSDEIAPNATATITIQSYVPLRFDSGSRQIGNIFVTGIAGNASISRSFPVYVEATSHLTIDRVDIEVETNSERVSEDESIDAKRNDAVSLEIRVKNTFSSSSDIDIDEVTVIVDNNELDIDEDIDLGDLQATDDDMVTISFDIPDDAEDSRESVIIEAEGVDQNGALHTETFRFYLDIEVERYDIQINTVSLSPSTVCIGSSVNVQVGIENTGIRDVTKGMVNIVADDLNFNRKITDITLDEGDDRTVTATIAVPQGTAQGTYLLEVESYYEPTNSALTAMTTSNIIVRDCSAVAQPRPPTTNTTTQAPSTGFEVVQPPSGAVFGQPVSRTSIFSNGNYLFALIAINVLLLIIIIGMLVASGRRYY